MKPCRMLRKIEISNGFLLFVCAYYYFDPADTFYSFFTAVLLHEAGHLIALHLMRVQIHRLRLRICGAEICTEVLPYSKELSAAVAGPVVNFLLLMLFAEQNPQFALLNLCLCAYNLLPLYPLDGGRVLRALLHMLLPARVAEIVERIIAASCISALIALSCYLTCVWHAGLWPILTCAFLLLKIAGTIFPRKNST